MAGFGSAAFAAALSIVLALGGCAPEIALGLAEVPPSDQRPSDEPLLAGKVHFAHADYGLAERKFRAAVEANPLSVDAWSGLAASYDRLHRFDLADKAYEKVLKLAGRTPEVLNNLGYHYLLKGDIERARRYLLAAARRDPGNPYIQGNLRLVETWSAGEPEIQHW